MLSFLNKHFQPLAWINLLYLYLVIAFGAFVRATGSGAGCGNHWPLCNGRIIQHQIQYTTAIEYTHRITSGILLLVAMLLWVVSKRNIRIPNKLKKYFIIYVFFLIIEALLGAMLVRFEHVAHNTSIFRGISVSFHYINTVFLSLSATLCVLSTRYPSNTSISFCKASRNRFIWAFAIMIVVGISGSLTALGDTLFPTTHSSEALLRAFSSTEHLFVKIRIYHPLLAIMSSLYFIYFCLWLNHKKKHNPLLRTLILSVLSLQIIVGFLNIHFFTPIHLQIIHIVLAQILWSSIIYQTWSANVQVTA